MENEATWTDFLLTLVVLSIFIVPLSIRMWNEPKPKNNDQ